MTILLGRDNATFLNNGEHVLIHYDQILDHESAPTPTIGYLDFYPNNTFGNVYMSEARCDEKGMGRVAKIKLTYNRSTNTASAEVVK